MNASERSGICSGAAARKNPGIRVGISMLVLTITHTKWQLTGQTKPIQRQPMNVAFSIRINSLSAGCVRQHVDRAGKQATFAGTRIGKGCRVTTLIGVQFEMSGRIARECHCTRSAARALHRGEFSPIYDRIKRSHLNCWGYARRRLAM